MLTGIFKPGDAVVVQFPTQDQEGAGAAPDALPTAALYRNGVADAEVAVTVAAAAGESALFNASFTIPADYAVGDCVSMVPTATVDGVTSPPTPLWQTRLDTPTNLLLAAMGSATVQTLVNAGSGYPREALGLTADDVAGGILYQVKGNDGRAVVVPSDATVSFVLRKKGAETATTIGGSVLFGALGFVASDAFDAEDAVPEAGDYEMTVSVAGLTYPLGHRIAVRIAESLD